MVPTTGEIEYTALYNEGTLGEESVAEV